MKEIVFLHTAPPNVEVFTRLMEELAPEIPARHLLHAELLEEAVRAGGINADLESRVVDALLKARRENTALVVCTCSTIGACADLAGREAPVTRIDRAMAEQAVETGPRIRVAACVATTVGPTRELIEAVASEKGKAVTVEILLLEAAWAKWLAGDREGYWQAIAEGLLSAPGDVDVVVLAQASMANAARLCGALGIPVLASPRLGVEAAVARYRGALS